VFSAIEEDLATVASTALSNQQRKVALAFLGHWVADIHQPLHVSFEDDRGGNEIGAYGVCASEFGSHNLHAVWATCLVVAPRALSIAEGLPGFATEATNLRQSITAEDRAEWCSTGPVAWADESFQIAVRPTTEYCAQESGVCRYSVYSEEWIP